MILEAKTITLKDGRKAVLKTPELGDGEKLLDHIQTCSGETDFLARCPEEWDMPLAREEAWIRDLREAPDALAIACYIDGEVVGNCEFRCHRGIKTRHRASIGISIRRKYWSLGIGSAMFNELIREARKHGVAILQLEYIAGNERGRLLYEKYGFHAIGERPKAFRLKDGTYQSEILMQREL
jgi:RimJ/RimL family protein N-acetyltransferase